MPRIMVVDDNAPIRRLLRRSLEEDGHTVLEAPNGRMALSYMGGGPVELVISDVFMPDVNGFDFLMSIRDAFPATRIIMISGGGDLGATPTLSAAANLGADRVFEKPFDLEEMLVAVRALLADDNCPA